jgi:predicted nucleic acid-binding protein
LLAAANRRDEAHGIAAELVTRLGRELVVPVPVIVEADQLLRARVGPHAARLFLAAVAAGEHEVAYLSAGLLRRAVEIDAGFGDLNLGFADAAVMAVAERHDLPILTFDFEHFRATRPRRGFWHLVIDQARYADSVQRR